MPFEPLADIELRDDFQRGIILEQRQDIGEVIVVRMGQQDRIVGTARDDFRTEIFRKRGVLDDERVEDKLLPAGPDEIKGGMAKPAHLHAVGKMFFAHGWLRQHMLDAGDDALLVGKSRLLEAIGIRLRHVQRCDAMHRRIEMIEKFVLHLIGHLRTPSGERLVFLDDE